MRRVPRSTSMRDPRHSTAARSALNPNTSAKKNNYGGCATTPNAAVYEARVHLRGSAASGAADASLRGADERGKSRVYVLGIATTGFNQALWIHSVSQGGDYGNALTHTRDASGAVEEVLLLVKLVRAGAVHTHTPRGAIHAQSTRGTRALHPNDCQG